MSPDTAVLVKRALELLLLPPAGPLWFVVLGIWVARRRPQTGTVIALAAVAASLLLSTAGFGQLLIAPLERDAGPALDQAALRALMARDEAPQAIVILGGGLRSDVHERPERYRPHARTTERLLYGAWVARVTDLPVLVTGGAPGDEPFSEAALMKRMLETRLGGRVKWVEEKALDTADNARRSAELLLAEKRRRVLLVTHAVHMPRARSAFERAGMEVTAAPHGFFGSPAHSGWFEWLPSADGVAINWLALHEIVGRVWYRLRGLE